MAKNVFLEATVILAFDHKNLIKLTLAPKLCAQFEDIPSRCSLRYTIHKNGTVGCVCASILTCFVFAFFLK